MLRLFWALLLIPFSVLPALSLEYQRVSFDDIAGWQADNLGNALTVFAGSCADIRSTNDIPSTDWQQVCALANAATDARGFFQNNFSPVRITDGNRTLFTGYFEPELPGSRTNTDVYRFPLYVPPPEVSGGKRWKTRAEIENGLLEGRGLELVWLDNPVDAFFVHVQGSARIRLPDGNTMRIGFAGRNSRDYRSVGRELIRLGVLTPGQASASGIRAWALSHPEAGRLALQHNTSFIFFQELQIPADLGPIGALQHPLTEMRSVAVDHAKTPLGAPVWITMEGGRLNQLMVAQDTGSAVKGAQRADIYFGSGVEAGNRAGRIRYGGEMLTLLPLATAQRLAGN